MHFTIGMIRDALAEGGLELYSEVPSARRFREFRPMRPDSEIRENCLYVTQGEAEAPCRLDLSGPRALLYAAEPERALTLLADRADLLREWNEQLLNLLLLDRSLSDVLNHCVPLFKNPLHIADSGFRTRAMSANYDFSRFRDGEAAYLFEHGFHSPEYISRIMGSPWFRALTTGSRRSAICNFDFLAHRNILAVIGDESRTFGYLTIIELETQLTEGMVDLSEYLAGLLANSFAGDRGALSPGRDQLDNVLFRDILRGDVTDPAQITAAFHRSGLPEGRQYMVAVLELEEGAGDDFLRLSVAEQLSQQLESSRCLVIDGCLTLVMQVDKAEQARALVSEACREQPFLSRCKRGFSLSFAAPLDVRLHYRQARAALRFGALAEPDSRHWSYDQVIVYDLLQHYGNAGSRRAILHPAIAQLEAHDREKGSNLLHSLRVLLRCRGDANTAAGALYLHRNSMYYRISQISAITGLDLQDDRVAEHLSISLCIHDMEQAEPAAE